MTEMSFGHLFNCVKGLAVNEEMDRGRGGDEKDGNGETELLVRVKCFESWVMAAFFDSGERSIYDQCMFNNYS